VTGSADVGRAGEVASAVGVAGAGLAAVAAAGISFAGLADSVRESDGIRVWDGPVNAVIAAHRSTGLTDAATVITRMGNTLSLIAITAVAALALAAWSRTWRPVWLTAVALAGSSTAVTVIKLVVARPRPDRSLAAILADGYSFPSGHTTNALAAFAVLAFAATTTVVVARRAQVAVWLATCLGAVVIGLSRVYLGVHYLSDVLAGWALATGWVMIVIAVDVLRRRRWYRRVTDTSPHAAGS
jgi:membrane-associated phospholipid phosphatase